MDTAEGNTVGENASALVGTTFGGIGDPLHSHVQAFSPGSVGATDNATNVYDTDNNLAGDNFRIDGGADQTFDSISVFSATITYTDGTTASISAVVFQDTSGNTYLAPETTFNADQAALEAGPIRSLTLDSLNTNNTNLTAIRETGNFVEADGTVDGTSGNDAIGSGFIDAEGDAVDGWDGDTDSIEAGAGNDTIHGGANMDTIRGGDGDDVIDGGDSTDFLFGGAGNDFFSDSGGLTSDDTIYGEAGNDTIAGGVREDYLDGGADADTFIIEDEFGNDTIIGGEGGTDSDTIDLSALSGPVAVTYTGDETGTITDGSDTITFSEVESLTLTDQADVVNGGLDGVGIDVYADGGDDTIQGGSGNDTLYGGDGQNDLDGGSGDDLLVGDATGTNSFSKLTGGTGGDTLDGSAGNWDIAHYYNSSAGVNVDTSDGLTEIGGDAQGDTLTGIEQIDGSNLYDDTLTAGAGTYELKGWGGNDSLTLADNAWGLADGGAGDDTIVGGTGDDSVAGGDGADLFVYEEASGADTVSDFNMADSGDGTTIDQLDVSDLTDAGGDPINAWDVVVTDTNGDGTGNAILTFPNGENITLQGILPSQVDGASELNAMGIPCFTAGTQIATPKGRIAVEDLRIGDLVSTLEHGSRPVRWIASSVIGDRNAPLPENVTPVRIKPGALGNRRALIVSPQHCILLNDRQKGRNVYVRAKHLAQETRLASFARGRWQVTYVHVLLEQHASLISNNIPSESFYPSPMALEMLSPFNRMKLYALIPGLLHNPVEDAYGPRAATVLTRKELRSMAANCRPDCCELA
ncbi:Hint domain-containing protein [uncultured Pelagimonas sp.]|uniref:Hint domain-containing protein n=1 Tax=uncultured Pelagimonas sp. TaxID=1618102 RepID=UPI00261D10D7|nr:Hint domain-containing protein [uncultured Pelagimonas sp.]